MAKMTGVRQRCTPSCPDRCRQHRWEFLVELPADEMGKRRQIKRGGFRTQREAAEARAEVLAQHRAGTLPDATKRKITTGQWLTEWLEGKLSARRLRPTTAKSYRQHIDDYLIPHLGRLRLVELRPEHIEAMFRAVRDERAARKMRPLSAASEQRILATLRNAVRAAQRRGLIHTDPTMPVEVRKDDGRKIDPWRPDEFDAFTRWLAGQDATSTFGRLAPIVHLVSRTGLRLGEVCGLRWQDVDLDAGVLTVRQQAQVVGRRLVYGAPKSERSTDRRVPLVPDAVAALKAHRRAQAAERLTWGEAWTEDGQELVFRQPGGAGVIPSYLSRQFTDAVAAAGLRRVRFHDLRHMAGTFMIANGVPLALVSAVLGHSSTAVTDRFYNHSTAADAAAYMARAFEARPYQSPYQLG